MKNKDVDIKSRIREVIEIRGGNASEIARAMKISPAYLASVLNSQDKGVSSTLLKAFCSIAIDPYWLITGNATMNIGDDSGETLESWKKKAIAYEIKIQELDIKLDRMGFLVEHLDTLLKSFHDEKAQHETGTKTRNAENAV